MSGIDLEFHSKHPTSAKLAEESGMLFPDGVTHDTRYVSPFPLFMKEGLGPYKWDVDGNRYIDYVSGHGSLILGHSHPDIVAAVAEQVSKGTHLGANTELEIRWAKSIKNLMPSIERIRFHSSGTEATMMAMRLARAYTGKDKIIKFQDHFHGWNDYASAGSDRGTGGIPSTTLESMIVLPDGDIDLVEDCLSKDKNIAAVIVEPSGAHMGSLPLHPDFLHDLREVTRKYNVVFIMDEVVTGFRLSKGGAQIRYGIDPDLTTMAKILAGGLPGGAVGGHVDIMDMIAHRGVSSWDDTYRVSHPGTFNANPLAAVAGATCLEILSKDDINLRADQAATKLKDGFNQIFGKMEVPGVAYGVSSLVQIAFGLECDAGEIWRIPRNEVGGGPKPGAKQGFKKAMLNAGVDTMGGSGLIVSGFHSDDDVSATITAFEEALIALRNENLV